MTGRARSRRCTSRAAAASVAGVARRVLMALLALASRTGLRLVHLAATSAVAAVASLAAHEEATGAASTTADTAAQARCQHTALAQVLFLVLTATQAAMPRVPTATLLAGLQATRTRTRTRTLDSLDRPQALLQVARAALHPLAMRLDLHQWRLGLAPLMLLRRLRQLPRLQWGTRPRLLPQQLRLRRMTSCLLRLRLAELALRQLHLPPARKAAVAAVPLCASGHVIHVIHAIHVIRATPPSACLSLVCRLRPLNFCFPSLPLPSLPLPARGQRCAALA